MRSGCALFWFFDNTSDSTLLLVHCGAPPWIVYGFYGETDIPVGVGSMHTSRRGSDA